MSEFHVEVVRVESVEKHPDADSLDLVKVYDYTLVAKHGEYAVGDLAVYLPLDSVMPKDPQWEFLGNSRRIKAKKIRGIFSYGMLAKLPAGEWNVGDDVAEAMGVTRWEDVSEPDGEKFKTFRTPQEPAPKGWVIPTYTDIEGLRKYSKYLEEGEEVVIGEKIHGCNMRAVSDGDKLWVASRTVLKKQDPKCLWWKVAEELGFEEKTKQYPFHVFFGEVFGQVQDLKYGIEQGKSTFRCFDVWSVKENRYLDHDEAYNMATSLGFVYVPILYRGPWSNDLKAMCEGNSTLAEHVREGFVVKPVKERSAKCGRVIFKMIGEGYLTRKGK